MAKKVNTENLVYLGPRIPGVAGHFAVYPPGGVPEGLMEMAGQCPAIKTMIMPLSETPEAEKQLAVENSRMAIIYRAIQNYVGGRK